MSEMQDKEIYFHVNSKTYEKEDLVKLIALFYASGNEKKALTLLQSLTVS